MMRIDELARRAGTTSRNIRAYQSKGLLPPPKLSGRTGLYDESHLTRLELIARLQERGFALSAIGELLAAWEQGSSLKDVLGFDEILLAPWTDEATEEITMSQLEELFPEIKEDGELLTRAVSLGLVEKQGDRLSAPSPALIRVGAELVAAGIPLASVLDQAEALKADAGRIADRFVQLFNRHVWEPFISGSSALADLAEVTGVLERLRPLAAESVQAFLAQAMQRRVEAQVLEDLQKSLAQSLSEGQTAAGA